MSWITRPYKLNIDFYPSKCENERGEREKERDRMGKKQQQKRLEIRLNTVHIHFT